ncbi:MAG: hypothetical protein NT166_08380 [Candidatus Aminicenantes bacterium]|nr:hypothetical protein [Candidatus Aminicenantes bacterium]
MAIRILGAIVGMVGGYIFIKGIAEASSYFNTSGAIELVTCLGVYGLSGAYIMNGKKGDDSKK